MRFYTVVLLVILADFSPKTVCFFNVWEYMTYLGLQMLHKYIIFAIESAYIAKFSNNLTIWANL